MSARQSGLRRCPCNPARMYPACCGALHAGARAGDAEALMRSRYSAYVLGLTDYLRVTWHPSTRPAQLDIGDALDRQIVWLGLRVKAHVPMADDRAEVEFIARYRSGGSRAARLHERSRFVREHGTWYYFDGVIDASA